MKARSQRTEKTDAGICMKAEGEVKHVEGRSRKQGRHENKQGQLTKEVQSRVLGLGRTGRQYQAVSKKQSQENSLQKLKTWEYKM